jgi:tetratricopeptide (TPR) repeat protein
MSRGVAYLWAKCQAMARLALGMRTSALEVFDRMVQRWPDDAYVRASRTHLYAEMKRMPEAVAEAQQLVAIDPGNAHHWYNLAYLLEGAERLEEALDAFRRATDLSPQLDLAWYGMGLVLIRLRRFDEAVPALKRNTELQPMSPYGWYQLARVHVDRHDPEAAVKVIRHLKGFEPKVAAQLERETGLLAGQPAS